ncbi:MAG TPA: glycosyltransferase [Ferrovibrio sp.]|jgi:predicted glycosyltransferase|uniref:glycosyltransferase family protein n=1 Tax=Ferrovibrio sp. TaxID=1917215 RepID=UPI002B4AC131|nr:glycosyltransferase [Ferrovibrio sp.]HLT78772.1 glycosyltransferase [Ferrovibrio sp.]
MVSRSDGTRVLIYSHDTFGLGHLRRCRTLAHALVERHRDMSVLIISGSPIIGSFDFRSRVDFVRIPGVIKLRDGQYTSLNLPMGIEETLKIRAEIIQHTARIFDPDIFIVDKEPLGLRGEVLETMKMLKARGTRLVLGLRDVMDEPSALAPEWERKNVMPALRTLFDQIWVYGLPQFCDPLEGIALPDRVRRKVVYTGYLPRFPAEAALEQQLPEITQRPFLLVTPGGGGDGEGLIEWVLRAYESQELLPYPALLVLGPFMQRERRVEFLGRVARLPRVEAITFDAHMEHLVQNAVGVVAMGGYNTFCEILSLDKRAIIVPRKRPRMEQYIRAHRADELGLVRMLEDDGSYDPAVMASALRNLPRQPLPSDVVIPGLLEGLDNVDRLVQPWLRPAASSADNVVELRG